MKTKRTLLILLIAILLSLSLTGCDPDRPVQVNISNNGNIHSNQFGQFILIENYLYYDSATRIVYLYNDVYGGHVYVPYYAPNGLPYRYNPETNTFEEIEVN